MNTRFRLPIVAFCMSSLLAACGSVTSGIDFQPPSGWTGTPAMFGRLQMWIKRDSAKDAVPQMLMLVKGDASDTHADFSALPPQYDKNLRVLHRGSTTLCGSQPADDIVAQGSDNHGRRSQIEMVSSVIGKNRYVAMYIRAVRAKPDAEAETAIHSLCPVK